MAAVKSLGWVTVASAGTPVQVSPSRLPAQSVFIQQVASNTGAMHVGVSGSMDPSDGTDMVASLVAPSASALPSFSITAENAPNGLDLQNLWIDAAVNGEEVLISYVEG